MTALYVPSTDDPDLDEDTLERVLELTGGENPVQFIAMDEPDTAEGLIDGINSPERLAGWRLANQSFFKSPREEITDALDEREAELTNEPTPTTDAQPVAATDGGTDSLSTVGNSEAVAESNALSEARNHHADSAPTTPPTHPDAKRLEAGEVLVVDRDGPTEYIWPATAEADEPYVLRTFDAEGDERLEPMGLDEKGIRRRVDLETERTTTDEIEKDAPATAATGGDA